MFLDTVTWGREGFRAGKITEAAGALELNGLFFTELGEASFINVIDLAITHCIYATYCI